VANDGTHLPARLQACRAKADAVRHYHEEQQGVGKAGTSFSRWQGDVMSGFTRRLILALCISSAPLVMAAAEEPALVAPVVLPGGGIANPAGKIGYFPSTTGGIDAVDLTSGKLIWESKEANRPLLATDKHLHVSAGVLARRSALGRR
jgi:hypothetical protein